MRIVRYKGVSLRLHKNGIWYYQFTVRGNTYNSTLKTTRLGEAKAKLDSGLIDKVNRMRLGLEITRDTASITLLEAVELYLKDVRSKIDQSRDYKQNLERIVNEFMNVIGKRAMLSEIGVPQKRQYIQWLRKYKSTLSKGGFNHRLKLLRVFDKWCTEYYNLDRDMLYIYR